MPKQYSKTLPAEFCVIRSVHRRGKNDSFGTILRQVDTPPVNEYTYCIAYPSRKSKRSRIVFMKSKGDKVLVQYMTVKEVTF